MRLGAVNRTLSTRCPSCGRAFDQAETSFIDSMPFVDPDQFAFGVPSGFILAAICNFFILIVIGPLVALMARPSNVLRRE